MSFGRGVLGKALISPEIGGGTSKKLCHRLTVEAGSVSSKTPNQGQNRRGFQPFMRLLFSLLPDFRDVRYYLHITTFVLFVGLAC